MNRLILLELLFLVILVIAMQMGVLNLDRTGNVFIGFAVVNLALGFLAWFGWPVLRGDISGPSPLTRQDSSESDSKSNPFAASKPSREVILVLFASSAIALALGLILIYMAP